MESAGQTGGFFSTNLSIYRSIWHSRAWNGIAGAFSLYLLLLLSVFSVRGSGFGGCLGNVDSRHIPIQIHESSTIYMNASEFVANQIKSWRLPSFGGLGFVPILWFVGNTGVSFCLI